MVTIVLLNVARMLAMPVTMFFAPLALTIFLPAMSSARSSAAVGAAASAAGAPSTPAGAGVGAAPSAVGAAPCAGAAFFAPFSPAALGALSALSADASGLASFSFFAGFFFSSAITVGIGQMRLTRLMDTGLGGGTANDTDRLAGTLAGARVGLGALPTDRQASQVADAAIALDALQPFQVHADLAAKIALNNVFAVLNGVNDLGELLLGEILRADR